MSLVFTLGDKMMPTPRELLLILLMMRVWTTENEQPALQPSEGPTPPPSGTVLTEQRLEKYALCRARLDPIAIRAVVEAHGRTGHRFEAYGARGHTFLPVYSDGLVEWLVYTGRGESDLTASDPFMLAISSPPRAGSAAAELQGEAERCGLGSAAVYWETTRRIAAVLDYLPESVRFRGLPAADIAERRSRRPPKRNGRFEELEDPSSPTSDQEIVAEKNVLERFLGRLGLCTTSTLADATASRRLVCWKGTTILGHPCGGDNQTRASSGYSEYDGVCYSPIGRPSGPRLRAACSRPGDVRRDLPKYPVLCSSGVWVHVFPCSSDLACHDLAGVVYPNFRGFSSCKGGFCYLGDQEYPILR
jgi:hypothetical protein